MANKWQMIAVLALLTCSLCLAANGPTNAATTTSPRQAGVAGSGILSAIGSMIPGVMGNMLPLVLLFGLGALMVPALGLGLLLREGRRNDHPYYPTNYYRSFPSFNINTSAIMEGMTDVFERVMKALDNVDKKYK